ncbi:YwqG family protein [Amycolatopsis sp. MtRt-6]|uniref:YwqG family protein n=1 Tax=Amycolatopsis sp. MtRt-6 TaxID=2792782 RepID=UPI001A8C51D4|nr:YwqG family protein [Amycolatopsis sp. MtRt-6]
MTSWRDRLSALAHERLPAELAAAWTGLFRPGIRLVSEGDGPPVGRIGGAPMLPEDVGWPEWPGRGPLDFVAAVDCAALPREFLSIPLPEAGTLLFFYFDAERRAADDIPEFGDVEAARVVFVPAGVPVTERAAPEGVDPYPARDLFGKVEATAPKSYHALLDETKTARGETLAEAAEKVLLRGSYTGDAVFGLLVRQVHPEGPHHQVGGFADPVQTAVEKEVAREVLGDHRDSRLLEEAARWVFLAQIDSDEAADMMWGDAGMLYWMIRSDDLEAGRFDRARCILQCC